MRKLLSTFALILLTAAGAWAYDFKSGDLYYNIIDEAAKTVEVTYEDQWSSSNYSSLSGAVTIPETVSYNSTTYSVTSIGDGAFYECSALTQVTIPGSVTSIGYYAFGYCSALTQVTIPGSVTSIGERAFHGCSALTQVTWNAINCVDFSYDYNTYIYPPFFDCPVTDFTFGEQVEHIPAGLCYGMDKLTQVNIPDGVTSIGNEAFYGCSALTQVTIPDGVESIGNWTFQECLALTQINIPESVTSIGDGAFHGCSALTQVTIGDGVESIEDYAFSGCNALTQVIIGSSVTSIGSEAFYGCSALTQVTIPNSVTSIGERAFLSCSALTQVNIPNSVESIGELAFASCEALTQVTIPGSVTSIGNSVFSNCSALTQVNIGDGVTSIGDYAFSRCSALTQVDIPGSVESIGSSAFSGCNALTQVTIGNSVANIGEGAFSGCSALAEMTVLATVPPTITENTFSNINPQVKVSIPEGSREAYMADENWKWLLDLSAGQLSGICGDNLTWTFTTADSTLTISGTGDMYNYSIFVMDQPWLNLYQGIKNISLQDGVTSIGGGAFAGCPTLTQVTIGNSVTSIGSQAFYDCSALTQVTIGDGVESIGNLAFANCSALKQVTIPGSVTSIGERAFYECSALAQVTIGNGVTSIGNYAFSDCSALTQVNIGDGVTSIGDYAFSDCSALAEMTVLATVPPTITASTFRNINPQVKVSIPEGSRDAYMADENWKWLLDLSAGELSGTCGDYLIWTFTTADSTLTISGTGDMYDYGYSDQPWYNFNQGIKNISLPDGMTSIGERAFYECSALTQVTIPGSVTSIGGSAFLRCSALTQVTWNAINCADFSYDYNTDLPFFDCPVTDFTFGDQVKHIPAYLCYGMDKLTQVNIPDGVKSIGDGAFLRCSALTQVNIPDGVESIGNWTFQECLALTQINIPDGVTSIGDYAFCECSALAQVTIPNSVTSIGERAFEDCSALTQVTIPNSVESIGERAFLGCSALMQVTLPESVTSIGNYAFSDCSALTQVTIPDGVESIGNYVFYECSALTQVTWNAINCVDLSYDYNTYPPFFDCPVTDFTFGDQVKHIPAYLCYGMDKLKQVTIGDGMTSIGNYAFYECSALAEMTVLATVPPTIGGASTFYNVSRDIPVYVPAEALEDYWVASVWKEFNLHAMPTALQTPSMPESIRVYGGMLHNPQGLPVSIYDMQGRMVYSGTAATVSQPAGVYVVLCAGASRKVLF